MIEIDTVLQTGQENNYNEVRIFTNREIMDANLIGPDTVGGHLWANYLYEFLKASGFGEYVSSYLTQKNKRGIAVLFVFEVQGRKDWSYLDGDREYSVQQWIDEHDGKYGCLVCLVNRCSSLNVRGKESLLIVPEKEASPKDLVLIHPVRGTVGPYILEREIEFIQNTEEFEKNFKSFLQRLSPCQRYVGMTYKEIQEIEFEDEEGRETAIMEAAGFAVLSALESFFPESDDDDIISDFKRKIKILMDICEKYKKMLSVEKSLEK